MSDCYAIQRLFLYLYSVLLSDVFLSVDNTKKVLEQTFPLKLQYLGMFKGKSETEKHPYIAPTVTEVDCSLYKMFSLCLVSAYNGPMTFNYSVEELNRTINYCS